MQALQPYLSKPRSPQRTETIKLLANETSHNSCQESDRGPCLCSSLPTIAKWPLNQQQKQLELAWPVPWKDITRSTRTKATWMCICSVKKRLSIDVWLSRWSSKVLWRIKPHKRKAVRSSSTLNYHLTNQQRCLTQASLTNIMKLGVWVSDSYTETNFLSWIEPWTWSTQGLALAARAISRTRNLTSQRTLPRSRIQNTKGRILRCLQSLNKGQSKTVCQTSENWKEKTGSNMEWRNQLTSGSTKWTTVGFQVSRFARQTSGPACLTKTLPRAFVKQIWLISSESIQYSTKVSTLIC